MKPAEQRKNGPRAAWKRVPWQLSLAAAVALAAAGCGQQPRPEAEALPSPSPSPIITLQATPSPSPTPKPYTFPLTGLGTDEPATSRPIMVMVENQEKARPQTGLNQADIVYEILAEGDITRFVAVYQSQSPQVIGPVRSIRPYFVDIGAGLDAIIVHAGWSQEAMNKLVDGHLNHLDQVYGDDAYYWRDNSRKAPHNLYTSIEKILKGAADKKFRTDWKDPGFTFVKEDESLQGDPANKAEIHYIQGYYVTYKYDPDTRQYMRYMVGEPHTDKETGEQLFTKNILICFAKHEIVDSAGRRHVDVFGPGEGYLLQDGKVRKVTWQRKGGIIRPFIDGQEVGLFPGKTWVQVVPIGSEISFQ